MSGVGLDLHAAAAAETLLSAPKLVLYCVECDGDAGGETGEGRHQAFAVGLARRFEPEHVPESSILTEMGSLRHFGASGGVLELRFGVRRSENLQNEPNWGVRLLGREGS